MTINLLEPTIPDQKLPTVWQRASRYITCLFCGLRGRQVGTLRLCACCLADPVQTRTAIHAELDHWLARQAAALETFEQACAAHLIHWQKILDAGHTPATDARARRAHPIYAQLLDAESTYQIALVSLTAERERLERSLQELDSIDA